LFGRSCKLWDVDTKSCIATFNFADKPAVEDMQVWHWPAVGWHWPAVEDMQARRQCPERLLGAARQAESCVTATALRAPALLSAAGGRRGYARRAPPRG
jgi:hypothetical protein